MMFQNGALFDSLTVAQNVAFPLREAGMRDDAEIAHRVTEALEIVRLPGQEQKMPSTCPAGCASAWRWRARWSSGRCCVLYDEPHAGLDPVTGDSIDHLIK